MRLQFLLSTVLVVSTSTGFCASADFVGSSSPLSFEHATQIPGDTLKAGAYSISIVEQIADRMIVRIDSQTSTNHAIFLGVPSTVAKIGGNTGAVNWPTGVNKTPTLRGFVFPNGDAVEFVYPKAEAAALAKDNKAAVVAVDPRSEGRVALKSLSQDELQIVNLWLLSLTSTGPDNKTPAVLARRYDGINVASGVAPVYPVEQRRVPTTPAQATPDTTVNRSVPAPLSPTVRATMAHRSPSSQPAARIARVPTVRSEPTVPTEVATLEAPAAPKVISQPARKTPMIAQLPHTAGFVPIVWVVGLLSLLGASLLRFGWVWTTRRGCELSYGS